MSSAISLYVGFPGPSVVKNRPVNAVDARDVDAIFGSGRHPGEENGNPLQYSCLENLMERGAWQATVPRVAKSRICLNQLSMHAYLCICLTIHIICTLSVLYHLFLPTVTEASWWWELLAFLRSNTWHKMDTEYWLLNKWTRLQRLWETAWKENIISQLSYIIFGYF